MHAKALYACPLPDSAELYIRAGCTRMRARRVHIISIGREDESVAYKTECIYKTITEDWPWELQAQNRR